MRKRFLGAATAVVLAAASVLVFTAGPANAIFAPGGFTADDQPTWQTNGIAWAVASAGNNVFVGGTFTAIRPPGAAAGTSEQPATNFAVFDAATGAPTSCHIGFDNGNHTATVRALNVSPDGQTLYVGGSFGSVTYTVNGNPVTDPVASMVAIDIASCTRITSFQPAVSATVRAIASTASSVFIGGDFPSVNGSAHAKIAKLDASGALVDSWNPAFDQPVLALAIPPAAGDDRLIVGGRFFTVTASGSTTANSSHALTVLTQDTGAVVKLFPGFIEQNSVVKALAVNPDGSAFYTGNEGTGTGVFDGRIAVSLGSGYPQIWRDNCLGATQAVVYYKGVIYSGSHAHDCSSMMEFGNGQRHHLNAELANPPASTPSLPQPQLLGWYPDTNDGIGEKIGPRAMTVANASSGDYLWVVGEFTTVNGHAQQGMTRFDTTTDNLSPIAPTISANSYDNGQVQVRFRAAMDTDEGSLTYSVYRDDTVIWTGQVNSSFWIRPQTTVLDAPGSGSHTYAVTASDGTHTTPKQAATATVTVASTNSVYDSAIDADHPSLHWRLDETSGGFAADSALNGSTPTNNPGDYPYPPSTMAYNQPGALANEPANPAITLNGQANLYSELRQPTPGAFSEETWIKTTTTKGGKIIGFGDAQISLSANYDRSIIMLNSGQLQFGAWTGGANVITSPKAYNDGKWHYLVATQGSSGMRLYVDNVLVASNGVTAGQAFPYGGYWRVGGDSVSGWPAAPSSAFFAGSIDEVAVYSTALSAAQIANHWNASTQTTSPPPPPPPTGTLTADFEAGTNGQTISPSDPGSATKWDANAGPAGGSGTTQVYDNTHVHSGNEAAKFATGNTLAAASVKWTGSLTPAPAAGPFYGRAYLYLTANPSPQTVPVSFMSGSFAIRVGVRITSNGNVAVVVNGNNVDKQTSARIPLNQWFRIELKAVGGTSTGAYELRLYNSADSTTPTETLSNSGINTGGTIDSLAFGATQQAKNQQPFWMDDLAASGTDWVGPTTSGSPPPPPPATSSLTGDFEAGTIGKTISPADAGSANKWDANAGPAGGSGTTQIYDNTHVYSGNEAAKFATDGTLAAASVKWTTSLTASAGAGPFYGRAYLYLTANPSPQIVPISFMSGSFAIRVGVRITSNGNLAVVVNGNTVDKQTTTRIPLNQWFRIELKAVGDPSNGGYELRLYNSPEATTPTETLSNSGINTGGTIDSLAFGATQQAKNQQPFWMDDLAASGDDWIGPSGGGASAV